jgi:hypothetical protein
MGVLILRCIRIHSSFIAQPISSVRHPLNELITNHSFDANGGFALFVAPEAIVRSFRDSHAKTNYGSLW